MLSQSDSPRGWKERGQVVVLFALLVPVILTIGSIVVSVGNWYVLKRHLQTQVDAAALAGGAVANGCQGDPLLVQNKIKLEALKYAGDVARATVPFNQQPEDIGDVRVVLNSTRYWEDPTDPTDGSSLDWTMGTPCTTKSLDVKATDYQVPLLFRWIPLFPSIKSRALVEFRKTKNTNGVRPIGVPEFDPQTVAALFVDEGVSGSTNPNSISGRGFINKQTLPSGDPLLQWNVWRGDVAGVNLNNTSNHSVVILASREPSANVDLNYGNGSLHDVCNQNPVQTRCFGGAGLNDGLSFIHIYSSAGGGINPPAVRDVTLSGGCPTDLSRPYFNLDGADSSGNGCTLAITANVDFGTGGANPTGYPTCATLDVPGGSTMSYIGGETWVGTYTFPTDPTGRFLIDLDWQTDKGGGNCGGQKWSGTLQDVAGAYVSDDKSDVVEYLKLENAGTPPPIDANSWPKTVSANVRVTVGFTPPLKDRPLTDPPIRLRFEKGPSQTQALDCGSGSGPNGWNGKMGTGCEAYQVNERTPTVSCSPPDLLTPPDCIASKNGNFNANGMKQIFANPCTPNNWDGVTIPPDTDPRWIPLFILDERSTTQSGKKYYPIRRFGGFYVTAGDGIEQGGAQCPGNVPTSVRRLELWGQFVTYFNPGFGETIPDDELCTFDDASLCVLSLVE